MPISLFQYLKHQYHPPLNFLSTLSMLQLFKLNIFSFPIILVLPFSGFPFLQHIYRKWEWEHIIISCFYAITSNSPLCAEYCYYTIITLLDRRIITFHAEKIADWVYNIYDTLGILRTRNNKLLVIYCEICAHCCTWASSIVLQNIPFFSQL